MDSSGLVPVLSIKESMEFKHLKENQTWTWTGGLHRILSMQGGENDDSYAKNSKAPALVISLMKPFLIQAIQSMKLFRDEPSLRIADLGCATGHNTLATIEVVVETLRQCYAEESHAMPEFEVFFSDLPSNDFNLLFQLLPELCDNKRCYYAAGVPGSFYRRLFPRGKLHMAVSLNAIQWLSQIPEAVLDKKSPAWNDGRVWIDVAAKREAVEAYAKQSEEDLKAFLQCRSDEIVEGGMLFLSMGGRPGSEPPENQIADPDSRTVHPFTTYMDQAWEDLLNDGLIDQETRDMFNIPVYMRSTNEVKKAFNLSTGFEIKMLEYHRIADHSKQAESIHNPESYGRVKANLARAALKPIIEAHLGPKLSKELFKRYEKRASSAIDMIHKTCFYGIIVVFAIRK